MRGVLKHVAPRLVLVPSPRPVSGLLLMATLGLVTADALAASAAAVVKAPVTSACLQRLDAHVDIGYDRIAARCPDLARQLNANDGSAWLPSAWKEPGNDLSPEGLRQLGLLVDREQSLRIAGRLPDVGALPGILGQLKRSARTPAGSWSRFGDWLRSLLQAREPGAEASSADGWLARTIARAGLPQAVIEVVSYAALVFVIVVALFIVFNELRASGCLGWVGRHRPARGPAVVGDGGIERDVNLEEVDPRERPRLLLERILRALVEYRQLPPPRAMTIRELSSAANLSGAGERRSFENLARLAERLRFSGAEVGGDSLTEVLGEGGELLNRVSARARADDQAMAHAGAGT